tara:strand:- start:3755 stop:4066 length:312 start_codon:yes stop_codon:yes gene_type:complete
MNEEKHYVLNNEVILKMFNIEHNELLRVSTALIGLKFEVETGMLMPMTKGRSLSVLQEYIKLPRVKKKAFDRLLELGIYKEKHGTRKKVSIYYGERRLPQSAT